MENKTTIELSDLPMYAAIIGIMALFTYRINTGIMKSDDWFFLGAYCMWGFNVASRWRREYVFKKRQQKINTNGN